ncbi:class I SAM-dependent methyltransferase [Streptomyces sp. Ncost-T10-10d]|uniref:class I SAM-dependent methyltransferase n=1 Tax=Streptomyces sp. Ncost-T10-10d TaxID=1839774 RepID=UPI00081E186A|nr:class I SAM-dependent methyltransferase [Streptomyces sp. Ncost-T10-10d]SCF98797.1 Ubiquinone/menaquinone biosynthesis C-methylase UbiE [Streptomyces sp. Ncost-T10-10d]
MQRIANRDQEKAWNGYEGNYWANNQDRWDGVNEGFNEPLLAAAAITERDRVLDIGCGAGCTTRLAARRASGGRASGLDLSAPMLARARESAQCEALGHVTFEQADVQVHPFGPGTFDVAISRFGVMFFDDPVTAFTNIGRALRPGGRIAFVCPAEPGRTEWLQAIQGLRDILPVGGLGAPGGPGMFSLSDPATVRDVLSRAGYEAIGTAPVEAYGTWGRDAVDAAAFLLDSGPGRHLMSQAGEDVRDRARRRLVDLLRPRERSGTLQLRSAALLVTARRPG